MGGQKKIKNVMKKFLFWFAVAERRQAKTHLIILDSVQKKLEFQPKGTALIKNKLAIAYFLLSVFIFLIIAPNSYI